VLRACRQLEEALTRLELGVALLAFAAMLALSLAEILGRNLFDAAVPRGDVVLRHLVLWVALPGAALAAVSGRHLHLDPANLAMRPLWRKVTAIPVNLIAAVVCALLTRAAWAFWLDEWQHRSTDAWLAWLSLILPAAFGLLALHFLLRAVLASEVKAP
jgi:TRAP-type C4-dicarboxylate transport system permease small subunit